MPRFELKKFVNLPLIAKESDVTHVTLYMVGRYVGTSFRKVVTFDDRDKALRFIKDYSGDDSQFCSDFVVYQFDIVVRFPVGFDPEPALRTSYYCSFDIIKPVE